MFSCFITGKSTSCKTSRDRLTDGPRADALQDWMLVGDLPWDLFTTIYQKLRIMRGSDAAGTGYIAPYLLHASSGSSAMRLLVAAVFFFVTGAGGVAFAAAAGWFPRESSPAVDTAVKAADLLCFATSWGATVWAIYVGGLVIFLNVPRHMMGRLRVKVFSACFALNAARTAVSAAAFAWLHRPWEETAAAGVERQRQLWILVAAAGLDLAMQPASLHPKDPQGLHQDQEKEEVKAGADALLRNTMTLIR